VNWRRPSPPDSSAAVRVVAVVALSSAGGETAVSPPWWPTANASSRVADRRPARRRRPIRISGLNRRIAWPSKASVPRCCLPGSNLQTQQSMKTHARP